MKAIVLITLFVLATVLSLTMYKVGMVFAVTYCLHRKGEALQGGAT